MDWIPITYMVRLCVFPLSVCSAPHRYWLSNHTCPRIVRSTPLEILVRFVLQAGIYEQIQQGWKSRALVRVAILPCIT